MRAEIHSVLAHNESSALGLRVDLRQFFAAMTTEGGKIIAFDYLKLFQSCLAHRAIGSFVVDPTGCNGSLPGFECIRGPGTADGQQRSLMRFRRTG